MRWACPRACSPTCAPATTSHTGSDMFLRADRVTLEFPLHTRREHAVGHGGGAPLGGQLVARGRRQYVRALDDVSFDLRDGDRRALVGHIGSGKWRLLRALA